MYFYHMRWGNRGWRHTPISQSSYGMVWRKNTIFPIPPPCQLPHWLLLHNWKRALRLREDQSVILLVPKWRGGQATIHLSNSYRTTTRPELNWNMSSSRRHRIWPKGTNVSKLNRPNGMQGGGNTCWTKQKPPSRRCFWRQIQQWPSNCYLGVSLQPCLYISTVVATATRLVEGVPSMSELHPMEPEPEPYCSPAPGPSRVLTSPPGTSPPLVSSTPDIPLLGTPLVGHSFPYLSTTSCLTALKLRGPESPLVKSRKEVSITHMGWWPCAWLNTRNQNWLWAIKMRVLQFFLSSTGGLANPDDETVTGSSKSTGDQASSDSGSSRGNSPDFNLDTASGDCLSCSDTDEVSIRTAHKKYIKRVKSVLQAK